MTICGVFYIFSGSSKNEAIHWGSAEKSGRADSLFLGISFERERAMNVWRHPLFFEVLSVLALAFCLTVTAQASEVIYEPVNKVEIARELSELKDQEMLLAEAQHALKMAKHHQGVAQVVLPLAVVAGLASYAAAERFSAQKVLNWLFRTGTRTAVATVVGDLVYLQFFNKDDLDHARVRVAFFQEQVKKAELALDLLYENAKP